MRSRRHYHIIDYLWRTILTFCGAPGGFAGAPQNCRHKNYFCGARGPCATEISTFCSAPSLVRHINSSAGLMQNISVAHACMVRHRKWYATKIKFVRHRNVKQKIRTFYPFCCTNTGIYSFIHKYMYI